MKRHLKWIVSFCICALSGTCFAQTYGMPPTSPGSTRTNYNAKEAKEATQSRMFLRSKDLVGATIKDSSGEKLGEIDEIVMNPKKGETFATVGIGNGRYALVPLQALTVSPPHGILHNADISLNATKQSLQ